MKTIKDELIVSSFKILLFQG